MDMRHRVYYAVNLNQNHDRFWWNSGYDSYGMVYDFNLEKLRSVVRSLKIRQLKHGTLSGGYYQMMVRCKQEEEHGLVAMLDQLKLANYEKLDGKEWV